MVTHKIVNVLGCNGKLNVMELPENVFTDEEGNDVDFEVLDVVRGSVIRRAAAGGR